MNRKYNNNKKKKYSNILYYLLIKPCPNKGPTNFPSFRMFICFAERTITTDTNEPNVTAFFLFLSTFFITFGLLNWLRVYLQLLAPHFVAILYRQNKIVRRRWKSIRINFKRILNLVCSLDCQHKMLSLSQRCTRAIVALHVLEACFAFASNVIIPTCVHTTVVVKAHNSHSNMQFLQTQCKFVSLYYVLGYGWEAEQNSSF